MRKSLVAVVVATGLIVPSVAMAHLGDYTTQLQNATKQCAARFSGCRLETHSTDPQGHGRGFLFSRNSTTNNQTCYQWYHANHDNVIDAEVFQGCF